MALDALAWAHQGEGVDPQALVFVAIGPVVVNLRQARGKLPVFGLGGFDDEKRQLGFQQQVQTGGRLAGTGHASDEHVLVQVLANQAHFVLGITPSPVDDDAQVKRLFLLRVWQINDEFDRPAPTNAWHFVLGQASDDGEFVRCHQGTQPVA